MLQSEVWATNMIRQKNKQKGVHSPEFWHKSLRMRFTLIFMFIMISVVGICIFMNRHFLEDFYLREKQDTVMELITEIDETLEANHFSGSREELTDSLSNEMIRILKQCWTQYNISVVILGTDGNVLFRSSSEMIDLHKRLSQYIIDGNMDVKKLYDNKRYQIVMMRESQSANRYMDAFGFLKNGCIFLMSTPVESIRESAAISNRFYMYTGLVVAFLSGLYIFFLMRRMMRPVLELSDIASRMAKQDFGVRYEGDSGDEIGILGNSMNYMAAELEKTITELKSANEQLQKDINEKIQIDDMRKEFLSNVSHELKTPIAIIQGYAEGLKECVNDDPEDREFYCDVIMDESQKMNQMVQKLMKLNQLEFGNQMLEITSFDLGEMIRGMMDATGVLFEQKDGIVEYRQFCESMQVTGDEFMIEEVLKNYLSNAANHLLQGGKVLVTAEDSTDNRIRVSVYNQGEHIPEEMLDKVWIKFFKVDKARTREYGGSGIGLSIVKAIMEQHGCPYGVENKEDGVMFWFEMNREKQSNCDWTA